MKGTTSAEQSSSKLVSDRRGLHLWCHSLTLTISGPDGLPKPSPLSSSSRTQGQLPDEPAKDCRGPPQPAGSQRPEARRHVQISDVSGRSSLSSAGPGNTQCSPQLHETQFSPYRQAEGLMHLILLCFSSGMSHLRSCNTLAHKFPFSSECH